MRRTTTNPLDELSALSMLLSWVWEKRYEEGEGRKGDGIDRKGKGKEEGGEENGKGGKRGGAARFEKILNLINERRQIHIDYRNVIGQS